MSALSRFVAIASSFKAVFFDQYGVLHDGRRPREDGDAVPREPSDSAPEIMLDDVDLQAKGDWPGEPDGEAPAIVVYTSGTTGPPKGVVLPRRALATNLDALADAWEWTGDDVVAHALPLTSGERRRAGAGYAATAALFVRKAALDISSPPEAIARLYKLTPTELRVLLAIVEIGGVPEVAEALGIGEATVKTHLHRLFAKTETTRQAELVTLVAASRADSSP